ncbi:M15 family metallopeptidase [Brevibacillus formosus]|uniref:M15 family metallopeptidase n=1 Tax=Brevibacillus TaxID=55080 RepID=UPI000D0E8EA1|nr:MULTISPECIES: M15 family metallopeptidase [Brevibacillus]MBG9943499.1 D-alanyl-D-alanine dipeptidase [Brevibacillus formosus]MED1948041.1 M15 family metallopeptidase [Brevibacillus formosus]MED1998228.1 M15 family metallopeptidase [Brevibacillus formosus]MED2080769.1 M15 family metallopeptidase [Brevibacillus formosus]PSK20562.1 D-alanyl-D-alanine dipeptidase [Brevibacillus sp. NRRL NRS-603]
MLFPPIPKIPDMVLPSPLPIKECGEPMIPLSSLAEQITVYPAYYHEGYAGTQPEAFLREGAARRLATAAAKLPVGYKLVVLDGWRSFEVQASLYARFREALLLQGWQEGPALTEQLSKFVAYPTTDLFKPSPHLSGGAVDLTIAGPDGWLEMGTAFDDFSERAETRHYEELVQPTQKDIEIRDHRRLLYHLMTAAGFVNYPKEWWHFEYGTRTWGQKTQQEPIYGGVLSM